MTSSAASLVVDSLVGLLGDMLTLQDALDDTLHRKLDALTRHDSLALRSAADDERAVSQDIARLDDRRRTVLARIHAAAVTAVDDFDTITNIAARVPPDAGRRLIDLSTALRTRMLAVANTHRATTQAVAEMLADDRRECSNAAPASRRAQSLSLSLPESVR